MDLYLSVRALVEKIPILNDFPFFSGLNGDLIIHNSLPLATSWELSNVTNFGSMVVADVSKFISHLRFCADNPEKVNFNLDDVLTVFEQLVSSPYYYSQLFFLIVFNPCNFVRFLNDVLVEKVFKDFPVYLKMVLAYRSIDVFSQSEDWFFPYLEIFSSVKEQGFFVHFIYPFVTLVDHSIVTPFGMKMIENDFLEIFNQWCFLHQDNLEWEPGSNINEHFFVVMSRHSRYNELTQLSSFVSCLGFVHRNHTIFHYMTRIVDYIVNPLIEDVLDTRLFDRLSSDDANEKNSAYEFLNFLILDMVFQNQPGCACDVVLFCQMNRFDLPFLELSDFFIHPFTEIYLPHILVAFASSEAFSCLMAFYRFSNIDWHALFQFALSRCLTYKADYIARNCPIKFKMIDYSLQLMVLNKEYATDCYGAAAMIANRNLLIFILYHLERYVNLPYEVANSLTDVDHSLTTSYGIFSALSLLLGQGYLRFNKPQSSIARFFFIVTALPKDIQENFGKILLGSKFFFTDKNIIDGCDFIVKRAKSHHLDNEHPYSINLKPLLFKIIPSIAVDPNYVAPKTFTSVTVTTSDDIIFAMAKADSQLANFKTTFDGIARWPCDELFVDKHGKIHHDKSHIIGPYVNYVHKKRPYAPVDPTIVATTRKLTSEIIAGVWFKKFASSVIGGEQNALIYKPNNYGEITYTVNDLNDVWLNSYRL
jgi:hypothetical protein